MLLEGGCSVMMADDRLQPEAKAILDKWSPHGGEKRPAAHYHRVDISDWAQVSALWHATLDKFEHVDIVVNGAGVYESPNAHGLSTLGSDDPDANPGVYKTFAVNTMGPIRLAQIAIDYWLEQRNVQGNLLWIASLGKYPHATPTPMYFASRSALASFVRSLASAQNDRGITNAAIVPGAIDGNDPITLSPCTVTRLNRAANLLLCRL